MLSKLSKYRREIMGFSIILIMICHTTLYFEQEVVRRIYFPFIDFCKIGVDVFFLMSGMGLYFSFHRDHNVRYFYKKRLLRIIPTYVFVILMWGMFSIPTGMEDGGSFLWKYSLLSFFINGNMAAWFVAAILVIYLVFPLIYAYIRRYSVYSLMLLIYAISLLLSVITAKVADFSVLKAVNEAFLVRIPTFLMGVHIGQCILQSNDRPVRKRYIGLVLVAGLVLLSLNAQRNVFCERWVERFLFLPLSVSISFILTYILEKLKPQSLVNRLLFFLGGITLEVYLTHEKILLVYNTYIPLCTMGSLLANFSAILVAVLFGYGINRTISLNKGINKVKT